MKNYTSQFSGILLLLTLSTFAMTFSSCKGDDDPFAAEKNRNLLVGNWQVNNVKVKGVDKTGDFAGLILQFVPGTFQATNGEPVWPASDTWAFTDDTATSFVRGDGVVVTITTITPMSLILTLSGEVTTWEATTGRANSVSGEYVFTFTR
jgi:hypothetical protein